MYTVLKLLVTFVSLSLLCGGHAYADSIRIQNASNGHWYQRFDTSMSWHSAKRYCEDKGGYLATITSLQENQFVYNRLLDASPNKHYCWLGATDELNEGTWRWITGETWDYTHWGTHEPNNSAGIEDYLMLLSTLDPEGRASFWNDLGSLNTGGCGAGCPDESYKMSTICEWSTETSLWSR
jgi:hypothetical protein